MKKDKLWNNIQKKDALWKEKRRRINYGINVEKDKLLKDKWQTEKEQL